LTEWLCKPVQRRKLSAVAAARDETDRWEGVRDLVVALDAAITIDHETDFFKGKRVIEASVFAFCR
jgi:hypothetical protein